MERWERALGKKDAEFKELFGVKKAMFHEMLAVLTESYEKRRRKGGVRAHAVAKFHGMDRTDA